MPRSGQSRSELRDVRALSGRGRKPRILWSAASNVIPRCLGTDEYVHVDLNAGVTINGTESYPVHVVFMSSTERRSTRATEAEAPSRRGLIAREVVGTADP